MNKDEKKKYAAVLRYDSELEESPRLVAKGRGKVAENILETAIEHGIPIQEDPALLELMTKLNINETIPEELYKAVAEVFAFIYKVDQNSK